MSRKRKEQKIKEKSITPGYPKKGTSAGWYTNPTGCFLLFSRKRVPEAT
jgi:hypothetical protein